jgi:hypothetical protein
MLFFDQSSYNLKVLRHKFAVKSQEIEPNWQVLPSEHQVLQLRNVER